MAKDFIDSILFNKEPISNWSLASKVVKILELGDRSLKSGGKEIFYK